MSNSEIILISISGEDKPGVTTAITEILGAYDATILDIGQADIHHTLSLGILFKMSDRTDSGNILKEVLFKCSELNLTPRFTPVSEERYNNWVSRQGKGRYVVTILGREITARQLSKVTKAVTNQELNIDSIKRLTGRVPLSNPDTDAIRSCIEIGRASCRERV